MRNWEWEMNQNEGEKERIKEILWIRISPWLFLCVCIGMSMICIVWCTGILGDVFFGINMTMIILFAFKLNIVRA